MIRSLGLLTILLGSIAFIIMNPAIGILMWTWISVMNPHRLTYGFIYSFPVGNLIAIATLIGWLIAKESKKLPLQPIVVLLLGYTLWTNVTTIFAIFPHAADKWEEFMKILLFTFLTMSVMKTRNRLHALVWINVLSIGYFALKGGAYTVLTGGSGRVWGPPGSFIADNNQLGLAMVMTLPLLRYLHSQAKHQYLRWAINGATGLWLLAILGTQSRGAFVAMGCMMLFLWIKSKNKLITGFLLLFVAGVSIAFMPASFKERMNSIQDYNEDASFQGRVTMWKFAIDLTKDRPILGGGFDAFYDEGLRNRYLPPGVPGRAVHSVYFEVLGEHGYPGLLLFLLMGVTAFFTCSRIQWLTARRPDLNWANRLAAMLQVCLVGYAVNGLTLNLATYDLYYTLLAMVVINRYLVAKAIRENPVPEGMVDTRWKPDQAMPTPRHT